MRLLYVHLTALYLFSQCSLKRINCRRLSWRQRCKKQIKCSRVLPNLEDICAKRYRYKETKRYRHVKEDQVFDVNLEDRVNGLDHNPNTFIYNNEESQIKNIFLAKIISGPTNTTVIVGGTAVLTCTVTGNPAPLTTIAPVLDGSLGGSFTTEMIQSNGIVSRVNVTNIIKHVTQGDEGWYQCSASNLYGGETRDAYLEVLDPCRGVECGGPEMECVVDNTTLTGQCRCRDFCRERKDLLPSPVCGSDCRTYSDFCNLQQTSCTDNADLKVLYNGQCAVNIGQIKVQITGWPGPLVLLYYSGDVIELECKVEGSPVFQISWYKVFPYQSLTKPHSMSRNTNRTRIKIDNWSESVVRMNRALLDDSALYQCSVVSCFDEEVFSEPVEVFVMEKFQTLTASQAGPVCSVFGGSEIVTFDLSSYTLTSSCDYVLSMECTRASWLIYGRTTPCGTSGTCLESLTIHSGRDVVGLHRGWVVSKGTSGRKVKLSEEESVRVGKFLVSFDGLHVTVNLPQQVSLSWDGISAAYIQLSDRNTLTCGLCGSFKSDHHVINMRERHQWNRESVEFEPFVKSWRVNPQDRCQDPADVPVLASLLTPDESTKLDTQCEEIFSSSVLQKCREEFPADIYLAKCQIQTRLKNHVLNNPVSVHCYLGMKYLEICSLITGVLVPPTLYQLGCPSTRFLQQFTVSIGCPQKVLPFQN